MARSLVTDIKTTKDFLIIHMEIRNRGRQESVTVKVQWKYIASTDAIDHIEAEISRRGRAREREGRPWLPLESWE